MDLILRMTNPVIGLKVMPSPVGFRLFAFKQDPAGEFTIRLDSMDFAGEQTNGTADDIMAECLRDQGVIPLDAIGHIGQSAARIWVTSHTEAEVIAAIKPWLRRILAAWASFINRFTMPPVGTPTTPGGSVTGSFESCDAAFAKAFSLVAATIDANGDVTFTLP
jgi:hypothetical protein